MIQPLDIDIVTFVDSLPKQLQDTYFSPETFELLERIQQEHELDDAQLSALGTLTGRVLIGAIPREEFAARLQEELQASESTVQEIATHLDEDVFEPIGELIAGAQKKYTRLKDLQTQKNTAPGQQPAEGPQHNEAGTSSEKTEEEGAPKPAAAPPPPPPTQEGPRKTTGDALQRETAPTAPAAQPAPTEGGAPQEPDRTATDTAVDEQVVPTPTAQTAGNAPAPKEREPEPRFERTPATRESAKEALSRKGSSAVPDREETAEPQPAVKPKPPQPQPQQQEPVAEEPRKEMSTEDTPVAPVEEPHEVETTVNEHKKVPYKEEREVQTTDLDGIAVEKESPEVTRQRIDGFNDFQETEHDTRNLSREDVLAQIENPDNDGPSDSRAGTKNVTPPETNDPDRRYGKEEDPYREPIE